MLFQPITLRIVCPFNVYFHIFDLNYKSGFCNLGFPQSGVTLRSSFISFAYIQQDDNELLPTEHFYLLFEFRSVVFFQIRCNALNYGDSPKGLSR